MEISGIAAIDIENHTAFHLEAVQTPNNLKSESLLYHYANTLVQRKSSLIDLSEYGFVSALSDHGLEGIGRLRDDANLRYKYTQEQSTGRGRPRKYDGTVDFNKLKQEHVNFIEESRENKIYQTVVYSKSLKTAINLAKITH